MEHASARSARFSLSGAGLAQVTRKLKHPRTRKKRMLPLGAFVPMPHAFRSRLPLPAAVSAGADMSTSGVREQEWVRSHWREYVGRWVALDGSRLVAEAPGAREVFEKARAAGVRSPFLVHVTEPSELPFGGW
jgi:hypothetical protein